MYGTLQLASEWNELSNVETVTDRLRDTCPDSCSVSAIHIDAIHLRFESDGKQCMKLLK